MLLLTRGTLAPCELPRGGDRPYEFQRVHIIAHAIEQPLFEPERSIEILKRSLDTSCLTGGLGVFRYPASTLVQRKNQAKTHLSWFVEAVHE